MAYLFICFNHGHKYRQMVLVNGRCLTVIYVILWKSAFWSQQILNMHGPAKETYMSSLTQPFVFLLVRSLLYLPGALSSVWLSLVINSRYGYVWLAWRWWLVLLRSDCDDPGSASGKGTGNWVWSGKLKSVKTFARLFIEPFFVFLFVFFFCVFHNTYI